MNYCTAPPHFPACSVCGMRRTLCPKCMPRLPLSKLNAASFFMMIPPSPLPSSKSFPLICPEIVVRDGMMVRSSLHPSRERSPVVGPFGAMGSNIDVELTALLKGRWTSAIEVDLPPAHFIGARSAISWSTSTSVIFSGCSCQQMTVGSPHILLGNCYN